MSPKEKKISKQDRDLAMRLCNEVRLPDDVHDLFMYIEMAWSLGMPVEETFYRGFKKFAVQYSPLKNH